jgi:Zn-dependent M32 family carboxypeptidase
VIAKALKIHESQSAPRGTQLGLSRAWTAHSVAKLSTNTSAAPRARES